MAHLSCDLTGKKAIVVGASRGLGASIAAVLSRAGADVVLGGRESTSLAAMAEQIRQVAKARVWTSTVDVTRWDDVARFAEQALGYVGGVDALVNVAGVQIRRASVEFTKQEWDSVIDTNLRGTFRCCQEFGRAMLAQGGGTIINVASLNSEISLPERTPYCASKAGVVALTKALALEWACHGIRVNAVSPGYFRTEMTVPLLQQEHWVSRLLLEVPMARVGDPSDLDGVILLLASDDAAYITGQNFFVDGGFTAGELL